LFIGLFDGIMKASDNEEVRAEENKCS